jgi:hypothetical protein
VFVAGFTALQSAGPTSDSGDPFSSISDFFDSGLWSAMRVMLQIFVVLLWIALAYWTWQDARKRIESPGLIAGCVALAIVLPFLGAIIYLVIRPPQYLDEARERELELLALEQRLGELGDSEGQEIIGRILQREGLDADPQARARSLRQAGLATHEDVRDIDQRLTELEFRLRGYDRAAAAVTRSDPAAVAPRDVNDPPTDPRRARREARPAPADTGRTGRWRRPRPDQEPYD